MIISSPPPNVQIFTEPPPPTSPGVVLLRQEVWGPDETLNDNGRYILRLPLELKWDKAVIEFKQAGDWAIMARLACNFTELFEVPIFPGQAALHIPADEWNPLGLSEPGLLPMDGEMYLILIIGSPVPYGNVWKGASVTLVKTT